MTEICIPDCSVCIVDMLVKRTYGVLGVGVGVGELEKSWDGVEFVLDRVGHLNKDDTILVVGGGALLDLVGFVASIYLRGIKIKYMPTTMMSLADAAIGGKTGINYKRTKNQLGTISPPISLHIYPKFIHT